jgi:2'-5' RNA ligase
VHLTLKFLGETREEQVPEILQALSVGLDGCKRFRLGVAGVGAFPNPAAARVVWAGVTGDLEQLAALQQAVECSLTSLGWNRESRPFTPHLTIGRIKRIRQRAVWLKGLAGAGDLKSEGFEVAAVSLFRSELTPTGALHHELGRVTLPPEKA